MCITQRYTYFLITESGVSGFWLLDVADYGTGCVWILGPGCPMWQITEPGRILSRPMDDI